jgi:hypothetical protein
MKRFGLISSVLALALFWTAHDSAAEPYRHPATGLLFPDRFAAMEKAGIRDFERENPGFGTSVSYNAPGITVTIYLYTAGLKSVPSNLASPVMRRHFAEVVGEVIGAGKRGGYYSNVKKISEEEVSLGAPHAEPRALLATFSYVQSGRERLSKLYLMGYKNHFLKVRFTYDKSVRSGAEETHKQFLRELTTMIQGKAGAPNRGAPPASR